MTRYGVNVLPILKGRNIYRPHIPRDCGKSPVPSALEKASLIDFATTDAITVGPSAPIREIETLMIEQNQRFMPVVENEKIIGAITRTDLLRTLYEEFLRRRKIEETVTKEKPADHGKKSLFLAEGEVPRGDL